MDPLGAQQVLSLLQSQEGACEAPAPPSTGGAFASHRYYTLLLTQLSAESYSLQATLQHLCEAFASHLPPHFFDACLQAFRAPLLPPNATLQALSEQRQRYTARLRPALEALHGLLQAPFAAQEARVGMAFSSLLGIVDGALLPMLTMAEGAALRSCSHCCKRVVEAFSFDLVAPAHRLRVHVAQWRACFPRARALNLSRYASASDADLVPSLRGIERWDLSSRGGIRGSCLELLAPSATHLNLSSCRGLQGSLLAQAFSSPGSRLHTLDISDTANILDEHFAGLGTLRVLRAARCTGLSGEYLKYLPRLLELNIAACAAPALEYFGALRQLTTLNVSSCEGITDEHFLALAQGGVKLAVLDMSKCLRITEEAFPYLSSCRLLYMGGCNQDAFLRNWEYLRSLEVLEMSFCHKNSIQGARAARLPVRL
jgi:hypothetical protein